MACARNVDIVITRQCLTLQKHCASIQALTRRAHACVCIYIYIYTCVCAGARACVSYVCVCMYMCVYARVWCPLSFDRYVMHKYFMTWATGARVPVRTLDHRIFWLCHLSREKKKKKKILWKERNRLEISISGDHKSRATILEEMDDKNLDDIPIEDKKQDVACKKKKENRFLPVRRIIFVMERGTVSWRIE